VGVLQFFAVLVDGGAQIWTRVHARTQGVDFAKIEPAIDHVLVRGVIKTMDGFGSVNSLQVGLEGVFVESY
jgi:hypothetical protein